MARKQKTIDEAVREVCLYLPETEEVMSRGSPDFRVVGGKTFATYVLNHHGDGRIALWLAAAPGAQQFHVERSSKHYFVPPYVGPRGWLGVNLNTGLDWRKVAERVREAYLAIAPRRLLKDVPPAIEIDPPTATVNAEDFDPMSPAHVQKIVAKLGKVCLALPETSADLSFGNPVWRAGKKTFCQAYRYTGRLQLAFWVGPDQQDLLTLDERFTIPAYMGHNGWIALDAEKGVTWSEVEQLVLGSYRHFALKRMLNALES
ncbi:MAG: MmcQ/YjbR family DNA-binding protein [Gammaproteobacteria bacterium]|nr:MmcQ/YjbR family DNA-binding protein [Gammaproteobacteria bacterium]